MPDWLRRVNIDWYIVCMICGAALCGGFICMEIWRSAAAINKIDLCDGQAIKLQGGHEKSDMHKAIHEAVLLPPRQAFVALKRLVHADKAEFERVLANDPELFHAVQTIVDQIKREGSRSKSRLSRNRWANV